MIIVYKFDDMKKLKEEVSVYHRENNQQITQHFKKSSYNFFPTFKLVASLASVLMIVFFVGIQMMSQNYQIPNASQKPQDMVVDKGESESVNDNTEEPTRNVEQGIYTVVNQRENASKMGYDIVLQVENVTVEYFSTSELILNQPYYFTDNQLYLAKYENGTWSYQMDNTWYKVNP